MNYFCTEVNDPVLTFPAKQAISTTVDVSQSSLRPDSPSLDVAPTEEENPNIQPEGNHSRISEEIKRTSTPLLPPQYADSTEDAHQSYLSFADNDFEGDEVYRFVRSTAPSPAPCFNFLSPNSPIYKPKVCIQTGTDIGDLPNELLDHIFTHLALDPGIGNASPLACRNAASVCLRWKSILERSPCQRLLIAAPDFLPCDAIHASPLARKFDAWFKHKNLDTLAFDTVSFELCVPSIRGSVNTRYAQFFTRALRKCRTARVIFELTLEDLRIKNHPLTKVTPHSTSALRDFSWSSEFVGIRYVLPPIYGFPWVTLKLDLPWLQLTQLELRCPLSVWDAHHVLACGSNLEVATLATLKLETVHVIQTTVPAVVPSLHTLTIETTLKIHALFNMLEMPALANFSLVFIQSFLSQPFFFPTLQILDMEINIPWQQLVGLEIQYRAFHPCDVAPILSRCSHLARLVLGGCLSVGTLSSFVTDLDELRLDSVDVPCDRILQSLHSTTIRRLQTTCAPSSCLTPFKIVDLRILKPIGLSLLLDFMKDLRECLQFGTFYLRGDSSLQDVDTQIVMKNLRVLHIVTTNKDTIGVISSTVTSKAVTSPLCIHAESSNIMV